MNGRFQAERISKPVTFANGESISSEINLEGHETFALQMPAEFTGTVITFLACDKSGGTYQSVYDASGSEVSVAVGTSRCVSLDTIALAISPYQWLKLRSGTAASPTAEGAARTLGMLM